MRKALLLTFGLIFSALIQAQEKNVELREIGSVADAFIALREATAQNDANGISRYSEAVRSYSLDYFLDLTCLDSTEVTPERNGFADSIINEIVQKHDRGENADGSYRTRTCFIKSGSSNRYELSSKGHQELAVIAEGGGLITLKVHVTNRHGLDVRYDDIKNVKTGLPQRQLSIDLPENTRNIIELEIINCGTKDCSCVIISN